MKVKRFRKIVESPTDYLKRKAKTGYYGSGFTLLLLFLILPVITPLIALIICYYKYKKERIIEYEEIK